MRHVKTLVLVVLGAAASAAAQQTDEPQSVPTQPGNGPRAILPPEQAEAGRRNRESLRNPGEVQMLDESRRADEALQLVQQSKGGAAGFQELDKASYGQFAKASINPAILDESYLTADSRSYVDLTSSEIAQIHTRTRYGTLLIEEYTDTSSYGGAEPNTLIGGKPANIVHIQHKDGWATAVYVQHGTSFFAVQNDRRIPESAVPDYLKMVEKLVLSAQDKRNASIE